MATLKEMEEELQKQRDLARELERKVQQARRDEARESRRALRPLAVKAHDAFCLWNHTDGCGWGYECDGYSGKGKPPEDEVWDRDCHAKWLGQVEELLKMAPLEDLERIVDGYAELKKIHRDAPRIILKLRA